MSLRDKKKAELRGRILAAAEKLFLEQGYDNTTTSQIAAEAGVASGTAFNYFDSKSELLLAAFAERLRAGGEPLGPRPATDDPVEIVFPFIWHYSRQLTAIDKPLLKELLLAFIAAYKNNPVLFGELLQEDLKAVNDIQLTLQELKAKRLLSAAFPDELAVELIYSAVVYEFVRYAFTDGTDERLLKERIKQKLAFLLR
ncbi:TetR/AcrR family transcriptional regulator [Paenibacillus sp.]|uniref:TetR/AcrR family transcriptional regulator n=1 Tax=Paenibacillus sp. TaxID=58172 RepID=UPI002D69319C|nr:TetR/AcrR family transcriptional regulator [Paenibacillus sp.]HZG56809.1 TetR/AcrR family transcriptional regulator [Paenibacillus sp.]